MDEQKYDDHIYIGEMLSFRAWSAFAVRRGWDEWFRPWIAQEWLCWFIEILKQSDDDPALFPHGKWASIQVAQGKVAAAAAGFRHSIPTDPTFRVDTTDSQPSGERKGR